MIKRILVALDADPDTLVATAYAAEIAQDFDAEVSGLAVVDTKHIATEVGGGGAIGGMYYADQIRKSLSDKSRAAARDLLATFEKNLDKQGVRHGERVEEGVPFRRIVEDMKYHDLLVIGRDPHFFFVRPEKRTGTLDEVVKQGVAPALVVGDGYRAIRRVLITYDGSDASARTMQRFVQLQPFGRKLAIELLHVRSGDAESVRNESELLLHLADGFVRAHGFEQVRETSLATGAPGAVIPAYAQETGADLIVAGAHSVSAMRRLAFGSTTHALLRDGDLPLFLFH